MAVKETTTRKISDYECSYRHKRYVGSRYIVRVINRHGIIPKDGRAVCGRHIAMLIAQEVINHRRGEKIKLELEVI